LEEGDEAVVEMTWGLFVWAGCGWLWLAVVLCRESCCLGKAAVLSCTLWLFGWLSGCKLVNCLKYPESREAGFFLLIYYK
jgi:hypothetical protein